MAEPPNIQVNLLFSRWRHGLIVAATVLVVLYFAYRLESVITPLLVSLMIAYVLNPFIRRMEEGGVPRLLVVSLVFILLGLLLALILAVVVPTLTSEITQFGKWVNQKHMLTSRPVVLQPDGEALGFSGVPPTSGPATTQPLAEKARAWLNNLTLIVETALTTRYEEMVRYAVTNIGTLLGSTFTVLNLVILIPIYTFFFLWRFDRVIAAIEFYLPADRKPRIVQVVKEIDEVAANFFRGRLIVCLFIGASTAVAFTIIGVRFAWLLGLVIGVLNLIPYIGPIIGICPSLLVAYLQFRDWQHPMYTFTSFAVLQLIDGFILTPIVQNKLVGLHPITTIVVLLMGGELAGVFGLILAVPAAAAIKILVREFLLPELGTQPVTALPVSAKLPAPAPPPKLKEEKHAC